MKKRDPNLFVFGSWFGDKFADNSKYLYLYFLQKVKKLTGLQRMKKYITSSNRMVYQLRWPIPKRESGFVAKLDTL